MKIQKIELNVIKAPYLAPFETSFAKQDDKVAIIVQLFSDSIIGYGECAALQGPFYSHETVKTCLHMIKDFIAPAIIGKEMSSIEDLVKALSFIRGNRMAMAAVEMAYWDVSARLQGAPLATMLGGTQDEIDSGVSIGIKEDVKTLLATIEEHLRLNYKKIKIKIKPGWDVEIVKAVRKEFPAIPLMVDANSAYTLGDIQRFQEIDAYDLLMIEQPLAYDDIVDHAKLQRELKTPICLDESIHSYDDARKAVELGSCKIINIKPSRVGGFYESKRIHDYCMEKGIPVWCGGMMEFGIGRVHNICLASLPNFTIPSDVSASKRYFKEDITIPRVDITERGTVLVPNEKNGIVYEVDERVIDKYTVEKIVL